MQNGSALTYTLNVTNIGNGTAASYTVFENYPNNVTFVSAVPANTSGNNTWNLTGLVPGASQTITINMNVRGDAVNGTLTNVVNLTDFRNASGTSWGNASAIELTTVLVDGAPPIVSLVSPANNTTIAGGSVVFTYNVTDDSIISSCGLILNGAVTQTSGVIANATSVSFTESLANTNRTWAVNCTDAQGLVGASTTWFVTIGAAPSTEQFSGGHGGKTAPYGRNGQWRTPEIIPAETTPETTPAEVVVSEPSRPRDTSQKSRKSSTSQKSSKDTTSKKSKVERR